MKKNSLNFIPYIEEEIVDRGLDAMVSSTGCLKYCEQGPVLVVYPQAYWYGGVNDERVVDRILDALEQGKPAEELLL
jgi:(2Fe-2S) ferredoxin